MALEFVFDTRSQRYKYRDSGKFVGQEAVRNLTQKAIDQVSQDVTTIADLLVQGKINVEAWETATAQALKNLYCWSFMLGAGGQKNIGSREYGILGGELKRQYQYLRKFSEHMVANGMSEPQFRTRLQLYAAGARNVYERGRLETHRQADYRWERRHRTKTDSCAECIEYEAVGWQPIGTLPNPGRECRCQSNCACYKEFSKDIATPADMLQWSRSNTLSKRRVCHLSRTIFNYGNNNTNSRPISINR